MKRYDPCFIVIVDRNVANIATAHCEPIPPVGHGAARLSADGVVETAVNGSIEK